MQYRIDPKTGKPVSLLGFGGMRFHKSQTEMERQIRYAVDQGVNFFDTAYIYSGSEAALGKAFEKDGLRARVNLCTKLPHYLVKKREDLDRYFNTQLERLKTDHVEYYMIHMLPSLQSWKWLCDLGIVEWVEEKQAEGKMGQFGFSFHGTAPAFLELIDAYDWDFCMIQYNYYDINYQAGRQGLRYAAERGIPVVVMEPLRGGMLVNKLPKDVSALWASAPGGRSAAEWALRWVFDHPEVLTTLSGMGTMEMVEENVRVAASHEPGTLTREEFALFDQARERIRATLKVDCTACGYCMPCPRGVDIPTCLSSLNDTILIGRWRSQTFYVATTEGHNASRCNRCGLCEPLCPQGVPIRETLGQVVRFLERPPYKVMRWVARRRLRTEKE
ncbi:MAG: aldo/keto reductase [Oscillospiraceae bacterium]|nr:aldo/keto reductase [Oscillospiraceae bacterium]